MSNAVSANNGFVCPEHSGCDARINNLENSEKEQWEAIDLIKNRLPGWATAVISLLHFLLGVAITYAGLKQG